MGCRWMTNERTVSGVRSARRTRSAFVGVTLSVLGASLATSFAPAAYAQAQRPSSAPSEELKAARELFQDAYKDEQEKRYAQALEKFQRVAAVKESASVRYRIASVIEALGRLHDARDAFRALAASKSTLAPTEQEVADSAAERAHALDRRMPKLVIRLQDNAPADVRVTIDGAPAPVTTAVRTIELDPGEHVILASSPTSSPSETKVQLVEGAEAQVVVTLTPLKTGAPPPPPPPTRNNTLAYVALGAGGVLFVTGVALLVVREGDISDIEAACPGGACPVGKRSDLESKRDQAELFGPLGVTLGVLGLAAAGTGAYLLLRRAPAGQDASPASALRSRSVESRDRFPSVRIGPRPVMGGAMIGASASF